MKRILAALALTPLLFTTGPLAQSVSDEVNRQLWCGTALVIFFSAQAPEATAEQLAEAQVKVDGGSALLGAAIQAHLDAGFAQEQIDAIRADLEPNVREQLASGTTPYTADECIALMQAALAAASSESSTPSSSAAM